MNHQDKNLPSPSNSSLCLSCKVTQHVFFFFVPSNWEWLQILGSKSCRVVPLSVRVVPLSVPVEWKLFYTTPSTLLWFVTPNTANCHPCFGGSWSGFSYSLSSLNILASHSTICANRTVFSGFQFDRINIKVLLMLFRYHAGFYSAFFIPWVSLKSQVLIFVNWFKFVSVSLTAHLRTEYSHPSLLPPRHPTRPSVRPSVRLSGGFH